MRIEDRLKKEAEWLKAEARRELMARPAEIFYMDDQGEIVPKEEATQVRILTTFWDGSRQEVYARVGPEKDGGKRS